MLAPLVAAGEVSASINAPDEVALDSDFTATVDIGEVVDLNAVQYDISFDPSVLRLDGITAGQIDSTEIPVQFNEISPGTYRVIQSMGLSTVSGSGYLAVLHFHTLLAGQSDINLVNGLLSGMEGEIPATWIGDSVNVISVKPSGQESPKVSVSPPETATTEPELEASREELLPTTSPPPEATAIEPEAKASRKELLPATSSLPKSGTIDTSNVTPAPTPPAPAVQTNHVNWPMLWGVIGGVAIVIGLIIFFQVRRRLDMR